MTRTAKVLLGLAIICFIVGGAFNLEIIDPRGIDALFTILPIGAVLFGLFLITLVLQRESDENPQDRHLSEPLSEGPAKHLPPEAHTGSQH